MVHVILVDHGFRDLLLDIQRLTAVLNHNIESIGFEVSDLNTKMQAKDLGIILWTLHCSSCF